MDLPALLVMDGSSTHDNTFTLDILKANRIDVLTLPAHTTHICQPLDVSIFRSMKQNFRTLYKSYEVTDGESEPSDTMKLRRQLLSSFHCALRGVRANRKIIRGAFKKCGIYPFNKDLLNSEFILKPAEEDPSGIF